MTATKSPYLFTGEGSAIDNYNGNGTDANNRVCTPNTDNWAIFDKNNQQHKTLLSILRQAQWTIPNDKWGEVADLDRLNKFLKSNKSPVNKPLKKMEPKEVSKVIEALKGIVKSKYK